MVDLTKEEMRFETKKQNKTNNEKKTKNETNQNKTKQKQTDTTATDRTFGNEYSLYPSSNHPLNFCLGRQFVTLVHLQKNHLRERKRKRERERGKRKRKKKAERKEEPEGRELKGAFLGLFIVTIALCSRKNLSLFVWKII